MNRDNLSLQNRIVSEQIRLIYKQGPVLAVGAGCAAIMATFFLWHAEPNVTLLFWLAAVFCTSLFRALIFRCYWQDVNRDRANSKWGCMFAWGSFFAGVVWGLWPVLFYAAYDPAYLLLISSIFAGMIAVLATSGSMYLPAFYAFAIPLVFPLAAFHVASGVHFLSWTGWLLVMFFFVNMALAIRGNKHSCELISARFHNTELMMQLSDEKVVAERAVVAKNQFIAAASHDLRQPLHAMSLFVSALGNTRLTSRQTMIATDLEKSVGSLKRLFDSLLDVSMLEANTLQPRVADFPIQELLDVMHNELLAEAECRQLTLQLQASDLIVRSDRILLERIMRNLLTNALRYTKKGGVSVSFEPMSGDQIVMKVCDSGIGIATEDLQCIFDEYRQIRKPDVRQGGMGLGLAIVRGLCDLLGHNLSVVSRLDYGTEFSLTLPLGHKQGITTEERVLQTSLTQSLCVLLIDDEQSILDATSGMLRDWGCEVLCATGPLHALELLAKTNSTPDFILTDYRLEDRQTGIEVVECVREWMNLEIPALVITGDTSPERLAEVSASGLPIMHKPLLAEELKSVILRYCRYDDSLAAKATSF